MRRATGLPPGLPRLEPQLVHRNKTVPIAGSLVKMRRATGLPPGLPRLEPQLVSYEKVPDTFSARASTHVSTLAIPARHTGRRVSLITNRALTVERRWELFGFDEVDGTDFRIEVQGSIIGYEEDFFLLADTASSTPGICHGTGVAQQTADLDDACDTVCEIDTNKETALRAQLVGARPILRNGR